jgi:hypothetical protein
MAPNKMGLVAFANLDYGIDQQSVNKNKENSCQYR